MNLNPNEKREKQKSRFVSIPIRDLMNLNPLMIMGITLNLK